jgi:hypothetical protein
MLSIECATNIELYKMLENDSFTEYYKNCILDELRKRKIKYETKLIIEALAK